MSLPANLGVAIVERFKATAGLVSGFSGGIYRSKANGKPGGSQLVFRITRARASFVSPGSEFLRKSVQFTCLSGNSNEADRLRQLVEEAYGGQPLEHAKGWTTALFVSNESEDENTRPVDPENMTYKSSIEFEFNECQVRGS